MTTKKVSKVLVEGKDVKKVLGVTSSIKNMLIAVAMIFAFLGGVFQLYGWLETTYAKAKQLQKVEIVNDYRWETTILNGMYTRQWTLDNVVNLVPDPLKVPIEIRTEYNDLKARIKLQEEKVKVLQEKCMDK